MTIYLIKTWSEQALIIFYINLHDGAAPHQNNTEIAAIFCTNIILSKFKLRTDCIEKRLLEIVTRPPEELHNIIIN